MPWTTPTRCAVSHRESQNIPGNMKSSVAMDLSTPSVLEPATPSDFDRPIFRAIAVASPSGGEDLSIITRSQMHSTLDENFDFLHRFHQLPQHLLPVEGIPAFLL